MSRGFSVRPCVNDAVSEDCGAAMAFSDAETHGLDDLAGPSHVLDDDGPRDYVLLGVTFANIAVATRARRRRDARERRARVRITHDDLEGSVAAAAQRLAEELGLAGRRALELLDATVNKLSDDVLRLDGLDVRLPPLRAAAGLDHALHVLAQDVGVDH